MAFDRARFQPLSFDMANPFLTGVEKGSNIMGDIIDSYYKNKEKKKIIEERELANALSREQLPFAKQMSEQKLKEQLLSNALKEVEAQNAPEVAQSDLAYKKARTMREEKMANDPFGGHALTGLAGENLSLKKLIDYYGKDSKEGIALQNQADVRAQKEAAMLKKNELANKAFNRNSMSTADKDAWDAQMRGLGYDEQAIQEAANQGMTLKEAASIKGYNGDDPSSWPQSVYHLSPENRTRVQRSDMALAELEAVEPLITAAIAPYSRRFGDGVSPKQVLDSFTGNNKRGVARFLAANAMQPELAGIRVNAMAGNVGEGAIDRIIEKSLGKIKVYESQIDSETYTMMQEEIQNMIRAMADARKDYANEDVNASRKSGSSQAENDPNDPAGLFK